MSQCPARGSENTPASVDQLNGPMIDPLQLGGNENIADLIDHVYARSGFNGRRLAEAAQLYSRMLNDGATVALTISGAMTPIGMSGVIISLMERGFVDSIVSTGANLYHDMHRPYDQPMVQGHWDVDDNKLADTGIARIYDVFIQDEDTLMATDQVILDALKSFEPDEQFSTAQLHYHLGKRIEDDAPHPERSFVAAAARLGVPIHTSSPGDSSLGMNLVIPQMFDRPVMLNPILDVIETTAIVADAEKNGVVEIGGGSPKNFYLQTQPTIKQILRDETRGGHDYFIQLTTDSPQWGGLSGATPSEARSWGKVKDAFINNVVVYSCASLTFPLLAQYVLIRNKPREPRNIYARLQDMVEDLRQRSLRNPLLQEELKTLYGKGD